MNLTEGHPIFLSFSFLCMVVGLYKVKHLQLYVSHSHDVCCGRLLSTKVLKLYILWMRLTYLIGCTALKKDLVFDFALHGYFRMLVPQAIKFKLWVHICVQSIHVIRWFRSPRSEVNLQSTNNLHRLLLWLTIYLSF